MLGCDISPGVHGVQRVLHDLSLLDDYIQRAGGSEYFTDEMLDNWIKRVVWLSPWPPLDPVALN